MKEIRFPLDGTYIEIIRFGRGKKPLIMISGMSLLGLEGQGEMIESFYREFTDDFDIFLFERKRIMPEWYRVKDMANDICRVLDAFGIKEGYFFGASQGGMIALEIALEHPDLVKKLVVASSSSRLKEKSKEVFRKWAALSEAQDSPGLFRNVNEKVYSEEYLKRSAEGFKNDVKPGTRENFERFICFCNACIEFDRLDDLDRIKCPALVTGASEDRVFGADEARIIADRIGCRYVEFKNASHAVYDESDEYRPMILEFLKK